MIRLIHTKYYKTLSKAFSFRFTTVKEDLSNERVSYEKGTLDEYSLDKDPFVAFANWYHEAKNTKEIREANAMILSTASKNGIPSARPVLLKVLLMEVWKTKFCIRLMMMMDLYFIQITEVERLKM